MGSILITFAAITNVSTQTTLRQSRVAKTLEGVLEIRATSIETKPTALVATSTRERIHISTQREAENAEHVRRCFGNDHGCDIVPAIPT